MTPILVPCSAGTLLTTEVILAVIVNSLKKVCYGAAYSTDLKMSIK